MDSAIGPSNWPEARRVTSSRRVNNSMGHFCLDVETVDFPPFAIDLVGGINSNNVGQFCLWLPAAASGGGLEECRWAPPGKRKLRA
jgi:hypothetical protein